MATSQTVRRVTRIEDFEAVSEEWNALALERGTPFLTFEWLSSWWEAFGQGGCACLLLTDPDGAVRAGAFCRSEGGRLRPATNAYTEDWDIVAQDNRARSQLWHELASAGARRLELRNLPAADPYPAMASQALGQAGYRTLVEPASASPVLSLPSTWEELLGRASRNLRSQLRRKQKALEDVGPVALQVVTGGDSKLEERLDTVLALEGSGWKSRAGSAIDSDPRSELLYRGFARLAAPRGWLRLYVLTVGDRPIAADYGCAYAGRGFLIKTGYDESCSAYSPGLLLRAAVLRSSIEEGLTAYDFLGGPDPYKLRWTSQTRSRTTVRAYSGLRALPAFLYRRRLRPALKSIRDQARRRSA